jgi:hypothetical protein
MATNKPESLGGLVGWVIFALTVWFVLPASWTDPLWYFYTYKVNIEQVHSNPKPRDCDFLHAPLGEKGCHYKKSVIGFNSTGDVVMVPDDQDEVVFGTDPKTGMRTVSFDQGKTWHDLDARPKSPDVKVSGVQINWIKVSD